jgi:hypothetical protein
MSGRRIKVDVTQEDIDQAVRSNSRKCAVAVALARTLPDATRISVDVQTVRFTDGRGVRRIYLTPTAPERYLISFDAGDKIEPFSFGLYDSQRVNVPRHPKTSTGKARDSAAAAVKYAEKKVSRLNADPNVTDTERALAYQQLAAKRERYEAAAAEPGPTQRTETPPEDDGVINAKKRGVRRYAGAATNVRQYGHRVMRINQVPTVGQ